MIASGGCSPPRKIDFLNDGATPVVEMDASGSVLATHTFGASGLVSRNTTTAGQPIGWHSPMAR
jgi:hypothetical protein